MGTTPEESPPRSEEASSPEAKRAALEADVAKSAKRVMNHMNRDHEDSLVAYVLAFAKGVEGTDPEKDKEDALLRNIQKGRLTIASAQLTQVDVDGFLLQVRVAEAGSSDALVLSNVRVPYQEPIQSARDLHHAAVAMHSMAYDKLGVWYKTKNGFYAQKAKLTAYQSYKALQKSEKLQTIYTMVGASIVVGVAGAAASRYLRSKTGQ